MSKALRDVASIYYGKSPRDVSDIDGEFPIIGTGGRFGQSRMSLFSGPAVVVPRKGSLGNPQYVGSPFWPVDTTYAVVPKRGVDAKWLYYVLDLYDLTRLNEATGVPSIRRDWLERLRVSPTPDHQQPRVAEILTTVDEAIKSSEALIAKSQQVKAGLMHDLFTRGVMPDGRLRSPREEVPELYKASPLGWIPGDWETTRLALVADVRSGIAKNAGRSLARPISVQYLRVANVQDGFLNLSEMKTIEVEESELERFRVLPNDVLMNEGGDLDKLGRGAIWPGSAEPCVHQNHVFVVRCGGSIIPGFLNAWTGTPQARRYFIVAGKQTTNLASINKTELGRLPVVLPPIDEQVRMVETLEAAEARRLVEEEALAKLRDLKNGLARAILNGSVAALGGCADV
jgi:type I restriction enzyme S subunit